MKLDRQTYALLTKWLKFMKKRNIKYCLFKNYDDFFRQKIDGNDFDIIVDKKHMIEIEEGLFSIFNSGYKIISKTSTDLVQEYWIIDFKHSQLFIIDIHFEFIVGSQVLITSEEIFENTTTLNGFKIINDLFNFKINILLIIYKNRYKKKYINSIKSSRFYTVELESILSMQDREVLLKYYNALFNDDKSIYKKRRFYNICMKVKTRLFWNKPLFVVLLGPDGAGKTTIGTSLEEKMLTLGINVDYFHYGKGKVFNTIKSSERGNDISIPVKKSRKDKLPKHLRKIYSILAYTKKEIMFIKQFFRYNKTYLCNIFINYKSKKISIIDRFPLNSCINRHQSKFESWLRKQLSFYVYKPKKVYFLHADTKVIHNRKKELTEEEIKKFMKYEVKLIKNRNIEYKVIDASKEVDIIVNEIIVDVIKSFPNEITGYTK